MRAVKSDTKTEWTTIRITVATHRRLRVVAAMRGMSTTEYLEQILQEQVVMDEDEFMAQIMAARAQK
jgi:plasmid stability protein